MMEIAPSELIIPGKSPFRHNNIPSQAPYDTLSVPTSDIIISPQEGVYAHKMQQPNANHTEKQKKSLPFLTFYSTSNTHTWLAPGSMAQWH